MQRLVDTVEVHEKITNLPGTDQLDIMPSSRRMRRYFEAQNDNKSWTVARGHEHSSLGSGAVVKRVQVHGRIRSL